MAQTSTSRDVRPFPKRRRLNPPPFSAVQPSITVTEPSPLKAPPLRPNPPTVCASCHRAAPANLLCARCTAPTCAVCSRTCTAAVSSPPPTPRLSWTPTPTPSPSHSPRRTALALIAPNSVPASANTTHALPNHGNAHPSAHAAAHPIGSFPPAGAPKRKKPRENGDGDANGDGCGRTICRECCFESEGMQEYVLFLSFVISLVSNASITQSFLNCFSPLSRLSLPRFPALHHLSRSR
ncbi:hypothetical protein C8R43DRAFT_1124306 [Mycena crocata]|nr:hypothetical protein C8R43DRAFT_1124306 [Mycena crocata]